MNTTETTFWNLIGSVSGTLISISFIGIVIYQGQLKKIIEDAKKISLSIHYKELIYINTALDLILLSLPLILSIYKLTGYVSVASTSIIISIIIIVIIMKRNFYGKSSQTNRDTILLFLEYKRKLVPVILILSSTMFICMPLLKVNIDTLCELFAVASLLLGIISTFITIIFLDMHGMIFKVDENFLISVTQAKSKLENNYSDLKSNHNKVTDFYNKQPQEDSYKNQYKQFTRRFINISDRETEILKASFKKNEIVTFNQVYGLHQNLNELENDIADLNKELRNVIK